MQYATLVSASDAIAATRSRKAKTALLAGVLREAAPEELPIVAAYLSGVLRQRRTGVGWRSLVDLPEPRQTPEVTVLEIEGCMQELAALAGAGSTGRRRELLTGLFSRLTGPEQEHLRGLLTGNLRQGALDALILEAVAAAADLLPDDLRRAAMFSADTGAIAQAALRDGAAGLLRFQPEAGSAIRPMLASSAATVTEAWSALSPEDGEQLAVDAKLDGIRIQVHRRAGQVQVFTRSLDEIGSRLAGVVQLVASLPGGDLVLDGEALVLDDGGRPVPFQETASSTASAESIAQPFFFDALVIDGQALIDRPASERLAALAAVLPPSSLVRRLTTSDPAAGEAFFAEAVAAGFEGVVVKRLSAPYAAGRRGSDWVKVKPRHTLDLVVIGVEWGSGRRRGLLSNIHLAARDPEKPGGFVMVGKTFKGMTDQMLAWQTERFRALQLNDDGWVVRVRPEQVVEIAFDGVQRSSRYPGGVALRFARVLRYRDDKTAAEADTIQNLRALLPS